MTNSIFAMLIAKLVRIMRHLTVLLLVLSWLAYSCSKQSQTADSDKNTTDKLVKVDKKNIANIGVSLHPDTKKEIQNWKEYQLVDAIITNFYAISNAEALSNSQELNSLVTNLRDSIHIEKHKTPAIKARINILQNECLRLEDMSNISAISPEEVTATIKRVLDAFSGLNAKLNAVYTVRDLESELKLDPDFLEILNDTTSTENLDFIITGKPNKPKQQLLEKKQLQQSSKKTLKEKKSN